MARTRLAPDPKVIAADPEVDMPFGGAAPVAGGSVPSDFVSAPTGSVDPAAALPPGAAPPAPTGALPSDPGVTSSEIGRQIETIVRRLNDLESIVMETIPQIVQMLALHDQAIQEIVNAAMQAMGGLPAGNSTPGNSALGNSALGNRMPGNPMPGGSASGNPTVGSPPRPR